MQCILEVLKFMNKLENTFKAQSAIKESRRYPSK